VEAGNFKTLAYSVVLSVGKSVLKMAETLWENSLIIAKDVRTIHGNFIVIAIYFVRKKLEPLLSYRPSHKEGVYFRWHGVHTKSC
jgi:hypothetical protein